MIRSIRFVLAVALLSFLLVFSSCTKKVSNVTITSLTGSGSYIAGGPNWDCILRFAATLSNTGEADAAIANWVAEIKEGDTVVITTSKNSPGDYQSHITPDPTGTYTVAAGSTFDFKLDRHWVMNVPDPYGGKNPKTIKMTVTVQDDESTYAIELTGTFTFARY